MASSKRSDAGKKEPLPPAALLIPAPEYPQVEDRSQAGSVLVQAWIDRNGNVVDAELLHSQLPAPFVSEALRSALECRFLPQADPKSKRGTRIVIPFRFFALADAPPAAVEDAPQLETAPRTAGAARNGLDESAQVDSEEIPGESEIPGEPVAGGTIAAAPSGGDADRNAEQRVPPPSTFKLPLAEARFGRSVVNREIQQTDGVFRTGERVYFWNRFDGAEVGEEIRHIWFLDGRIVQEIPLTLTRADWHSWSYKTLFPGLTGEWSVEVHRADGTLLGRSGFVCLPISPSD